MSRRLVLAAVLASGVAAADPEPTATPAPATAVPTPDAGSAAATPATGSAADPNAGSAVLLPDPGSAAAPLAPPDLSDQAVDVDIGVATGGRVTPGGLRIAGHYLYQLSDRDWFDGAASFTFGGGAAACFYDRSDAYICDHGLAQGDGFELSAQVRHFLGGHGTYWPYLHAGIGAGYVRFGNDDVGGLAIPLHAGAGMRASLTPAIAIDAQAELDAGIGFFGHGVGVEPQLGLDLTVGVEFRL